MLAEAGEAITRVASAPCDVRLYALMRTCRHATVLPEYA